MRTVKLEEQGIEVVYCVNCTSLYYDFQRSSRELLHCVYCGWRLGRSIGKEDMTTQRPITEAFEDLKAIYEQNKAEIKKRTT